MVKSLKDMPAVVNKPEARQKRSKKDAKGIPGTVFMNAKINSSLKKEIKKHCTLRRITIRYFVEETIREYLHAGLLSRKQSISSKITGDMSIRLAELAAERSGGVVHMLRPKSKRAGRLNVEVSIDAQCKMKLLCVSTGATIQYFLEEAITWKLKKESNEKEGGG